MVTCVVEVLDEDSRVEGCFKNKKVFIEESSSAQTILKVSQVFYRQIMWYNALASAALCLDRPLAPPPAGVISYRTLTQFKVSGKIPQQTHRTVTA